MTGVGGILRDIFTMGARPIACMDALRFGEIDAPRMRSLIDGVVRGSRRLRQLRGDPHRRRRDRLPPLLQRQHPGQRLRPRHRPARPRLPRPRERRRQPAPLRGEPHRAGTASTAPPWPPSRSTRRARQKRPTVQVGDPFTEKILLEACLEAMRTGAIVAIQDMGAAGLTSSTFEMAGRGGTGLHLDLDRVPLREEGLTPYEMMLSESQERMVLVAKKGREEEVEKVFRRWGLEVAKIGEVTDTGRAVLTWRGETAADIPIRPLTEEAPVYHRPVAEPSDLAERWQRPRGAAAVRSPGVARAPARHAGASPARPGSGPVRPHRAHQHGAGPGRRRRGAAAQGDAGRARHDLRRQPGLLLPRPAPRRRPGGGRVGAQPRLRRRRPGGAHRLPQLRQPRAAGGLLAVPRGDPRHLRGLPRASACR